MIGSLCWAIHVGDAHRGSEVKPIWQLGPRSSCWMFFWRICLSRRSISSRICSRCKLCGAVDNVPGFCTISSKNAHLAMGQKPYRIPSQHPNPHLPQNATIGFNPQTSPLCHSQGGSLNTEVGFTTHQGGFLGTEVGSRAGFLSTPSHGVLVLLGQCWGLQVVSFSGARLQVVSFWGATGSWPQMCPAGLC